MSCFLMSQGVTCPNSESCMSEDGSDAEFSAPLASGDFCVLCDEAAGSLDRAESDGEHPEYQGHSKVLV